MKANIGTHARRVRRSDEGRSVNGLPWETGNKKVFIPEEYEKLILRAFVVFMREVKSRGMQDELLAEYCGDMRVEGGWNVVFDGPNEEEFAELFIEKFEELKKREES